MSTASSTQFHATGPATDALAEGAPQWTAEGGDWDEIAAEIAARDEQDRLEHDRIVVNMGPVHPSTHGVLRLVLETDGEKVTVTGSWDSEEEARSVGEEIEQLQRQGHILDEIAILVRASYQMREFEDRFVTLGLPYRVIGGPRFYERAEIRDALAYLRVVNQPADDLAFASQRVRPGVLEERGHPFRYPAVDDALAHLLGG